MAADRWRQTTLPIGELRPAGLYVRWVDDRGTVRRWERVGPGPEEVIRGPQIPLVR